MDTSRYRKGLMITPFIPPLWWIFTSSMTSDGHSGLSVFLYTVLLLVSVGMVVVYVLQLRYLKKTLGYNPRNQKILIAVCSLVPVIALLVGDAGGAAHFSDEANWLAQLSFGVVALFLATILINICAIGNVWLITTGKITSAQKITSLIFQVLIYILICIISYFGYLLAYGLHDPDAQ